MAVDGRGVIYIGHLPSGFEEKELKEYFSQFGSVTRLKLFRSHKTGGSKGYAFVEFASAQVAPIAAESMHGYLMFNKVLQCKVVPPEKMYPSLFHGSNRIFKPSASWKRANLLRNKERDEETSAKVANRQKTRVEAKLAKLRALGLNPPVPFAQKTDPKTELKPSKNGKQTELSKNKAPKREKLRTTSSKVKPGRKLLL